ncbi:MAG: glycosyltransferase family 39 protein [Bryobacterales bacterium]
MKAKTLAAGVLLVLGVYFLLFHGMSRRGLVGPDEPRYAAIAREMAESGDWVTPRLDGEPWFEKPALLYWMGALTARLGLDDDRATRLPVALMSAAFLAFFYWRLKREFGPQPAEYAALILATAAGWVAFSQVGGFDLPLSVTLSAALLLLLPWVQEPSAESRKLLPAFGALLGLAVLAKGLVGPALAVVALLPVVWHRGIPLVVRDLFHPKTIGPFFAVALPWYLLCYVRNGAPFFEEFFLRHHLDRLADPSIQHVQPWWFYAPVLLVALLPWTPLMAVLPSEETKKDPRARFLAAWAIGTLLFFSFPINKLPGYLLPMLPPAAALSGLALATRKGGRLALTAAAALLGLMPVAASLLPPALADGLTDAWPPESISPLWLALTAMAAGAVAVLSWLDRRRAAVAVLAACAALSFILLKWQTFPAISQRAGARELWRQIDPQSDKTCLGEVRRHVADGLRYYSHGRLPDCSSQQRPYRVESDPPVLVGPQAKR